MSVITYLTNIIFAEGAASDLGGALARVGIFSPLVVTDAGLVAAGVVDRLRAGTPALAKAAVFSDTPTNPTEAAVLAALALYRDAGCDGIVALGGGSPIDLAKAVALLSTHPEPLARYAAIEGGLERISDGVAPVIAIPTTAGTGSEVGRAALITLEDGRKLGIISPRLIPTLAICDPELTLGLPPMLTAATGFDAITHCVETFLSPRFNPPADAIALDGLRRAVDWIERAVATGTDRVARSEMMMAALQGGLTFQKGLGGVHALSHPLGGQSKVPLHHGTLNAILLPGTLKRNERAAPAKFERLRAVLGLADGADLPEYFAALSERVGLPKTLGEMGTDKAILPAVAAAARKDHSHASNPADLSEVEYLEILTEAF